MQFRGKVSGVQGVEKELDKLGKRVGKGSGDICKETGGWTAQNLARYVQPMGLGGAARKTMERAIRGDIRMVGLPVKHPGAASRSELAAAHRAAKNKRGSVTAQKSRKKLPVRQGDFQAYIEEVQGRAGWAKAGWVKAAKNLKGKANFQKWIRRHDAPGAGTFKKSIWRPRATISNRVGYVSSTRVLGSSAKQKALRGARYRMRTALRKQVEKDSRKSKRKL